MALFIKGMGNISAQKTWDVDALPEEVVLPTSDRFTAIEPDYPQYIDPKSIRRMSRIIKFGVSAATLALRGANVNVPDAIITGTGYGCLEDTGTFLSKMIENNEVALNPTPFIQSTHNTIGSQIALLLQCQGYNQTYAHGAFSFESVLLDALIQSEESPDKNILMGGVDEITDVSHTIQKRFEIFNHVANGEGSAFFVVNGQSTNAIASIDSVATFYKPDVAIIRNHLDELKTQKIDLVLVGAVDSSPSPLLVNTVNQAFPSAAIGYFKHLCGEYPVASAFGVWLGATVLKTGKAPEAVVKARINSPKKVLILNQYFGKHYSAIVMSAC